MVNENRNSKEYIPGACSCMTLTSQSGKHYWFRTCDIDTDLWKAGAHVRKQAAGEIIEYCDGSKEISQYSFVGMTYNTLDTWLLDGVNEYGLTGGLLMLYEGTSVEKTEKNRIGYAGMELVTKILSSCKNVEGIIALVKCIQILDVFWEEKRLPATMHYFFTDISGNEVILEATDQEHPGILKIFPRENILGVLTNSPSYEDQLQNLVWFLSQSPELKQGLLGQAVTKVRQETTGQAIAEVNQETTGQDITEVKQEVNGQAPVGEKHPMTRHEPVELVLDKRSIKADENAKHLSLTGTFPASYSSYDRFIRLAVLKALNDSGNGFEDEKMLALGSGIMNAVCEPHTKGIFHYTRMDSRGKMIGQKDSFTQYMVMYDVEEKCFYIKKYDEVTWERYKVF